MRNGDGDKIQSVGRALETLEIIAEEGEMGVTDLGRRLGVHKATASRLASTLAEHGLIERDPRTDRYRLGFTLIYLAGAAMSDLDLVTTGRPIVQELAAQTRETVNLGVAHADSVVCIDQATGTSAIVSVSWVGRRTPLHCTSNGKVLLAWMGEPEVKRLLAGPLEARTARTIIDPKALMADLAEVRARGYAQTIEELEEGLNAVAAPVRRADGEVVAALTVSGPAFRMRPIDLPRVARDTVEAATAISRRLGFSTRQAAGLR